MKNVKPMLGAMSIVGKDSLGRKIILPTSSDKIVTEPREKTSKIKSFINAIIRKVTEIKINPLEFKTKMVRMKMADYDKICRSYMEGVSERIAKAQEAKKKNARAAMGLNY